MSRLQKYRSDMTKPIKVDVVSKPSLPSEPQPSGPLVSRRDPTAVNQNLGPSAAPKSLSTTIKKPNTDFVTKQMAKNLKQVYEYIGKFGALSSPRRLALAANTSQQEAQKFLEKQESYTLHRRAVRPKHFRKTIALYPFEIAQAGLMSLDGSYAKHNAPYKFLLVIIDVFSRRLFVKPLKRSGWKMALVSLHLTNSFDSLRQDQDYFFKLFRFVGDSKDPSKRLGTKITLPKNKQYNTIPEIIKDMNNLVYTGKDSVNFHYNKLYDRVYILGLKVGESCYLSDGLREVLGYKENIIEPEPDNNFHQTYGIEGPLVPGLYYQWNSIFVYTDIVQRSRIGNTSSPILRILPRKTTNEEVISYSFQPLIYLDMSRQNIEIVHFSLRTEKNNIIPFNRGLISLTVEFRKDE
ncbi:hypothetical protein QYM36_007675 [Artemia franciscana]|uniref:Uncharacterized protein n=1 Tax=Artemia franciscana TaxID=6661 RepID=A0AA88IE06_ARTSF|nr:hypothetical protein QYM36_007675 [Artemia franciscana]